MKKKSVILPKHAVANRCSVQINPRNTPVWQALRNQVEAALGLHSDTRYNADGWAKVGVRCLAPTGTWLKLGLYLGADGT